MTTTRVRFWVDPICPWCWVTARWAVEVAPQRNAEIVWEPISLLFKNQPPADSPFHEPLVWTLGLLRVMEAVRAAEGDAPLGALYFEFGRRIHHERERGWPAAEALAAVGLDGSYADAVDDASWDEVIRTRMDEGLALVGADVGTPIIAFPGPDGTEMGIFGPVITKVPEGEQALRLWDTVTALTAVDGFWELKRTRTAPPDPGAPPVITPVR